MSVLYRFYSTTFSLLFIAVFFLQTFVFQEPTIGVILLAIYLGWFGFQTGKRFGPHESYGQTWWMGTWVLLSVIMVIGTIAYYIASVPAALFQGLVLITPFLVSRIHPPTVWQHLQDLWHHKISHHLHAVPRSVYICASIVLVLNIAFVEYVGSHPAMQAVRSVWDVIPAPFLILFFLAILLTFTLLYRGREVSLAFPLFVLCLFTLVSFQTILLPLGAGFDSFIHRATEMHIAEFGTITPKPFYYIGQYTLILFFSHAFSLPVSLVDTWLVSLLTILLLPLAWLGAASHMVSQKKTAFFSLVGIFFLPLAIFSITTPQALAHLWTILLILAVVPFLLEKDRPLWWMYALGAIATVLIHPISGIPAIFFVCLLGLQTQKYRLPVWAFRLIQTIVVLFACLGLPLSFCVNALLQHQPLPLHISFSLFSPLATTGFLLENKFKPLLDGIYFLGKHTWLWISAIAVCAYMYYRKELSERVMALWIMVAVLGINYLLLSTVVDFSFLIDYERGNYADRLLPLALFFLVPFFLLGFNHISANLRSRPIVLKVFVVVLFASVATSVFYLAYPRRDVYETSHAFNVGLADVHAVELMETWANKQPYLVLANQSVSAAAIQEIGFRYFGNQFFYPIPTGAAMYQLFLRMNGHPNKNIVQEATMLIPADAGVKTVFYVVNQYWWNAPAIIESTKAIATDWKSVDDGLVYIFRFDL